MRRKSLDYHFHPLISQHDVRAPDLSLPIKTLSSTAIRKIMNSRWQFLIPQISRLGSQEIWKRDFVYVDDLAILSSACARFVIGQEGGPGGGGARGGGWCSTWNCPERNLKNIEKY